MPGGGRVNRTILGRVFLTISTTGTRSDPPPTSASCCTSIPTRRRRSPPPTAPRTSSTPRRSAERCTAALLLEVDPVALVRRGKGKGRGGAPDAALAQYVNDRPYAASSLLAVALSAVFSSALNGVCRARPERAARPHAAAHRGARAAGARRRRAGREALRAARLDEVDGRARSAGRAVPGVGRLAVRTARAGGRAAARRRAAAAVRPAAGARRRQALLGRARRGGQAAAGRRGLAGRPPRAEADHQPLSVPALGADPAGDGAAGAGAARRGDDIAVEEHRQRGGRDDGHRGEAGAARRAAARRRSSRRCAPPGRAGCSTWAADRASWCRRCSRTCASPRSSASMCRCARSTIAARRLKLDRMGERQAGRVTLLQGSLTYTDKRLKGYDAAVLSEVIEHLDLPRLPALEYAVFGSARPQTVLVTTPNVEYNVRWETLPGRACAPRRPPLRVDPGGVPGLGAGGGRTARVRRRVRAGRARRPRGGAAHADGRLHEDRRGRHEEEGGEGSMTDNDTGNDTEKNTGTHRTLPVTDLSLVVLIGATGSGKSTFAAQALQAHRDHLLRLLPRPRRRRRERPERQRRRLRRAALHRGQAARRRAAHRRRRHQRPGREPQAAGRSWPGSTTCCRSRSCSTCPRRSAPSATPPAPTGPACRATSSSATAANCAVRCAAWSARASARCTSCAASEEAEHAEVVPRAATTTSPTSPAPSTSSATSTAAAPSWRPCSASSVTSTACTPRAVRPSSSATSSTAAPTAPACCAASCPWSSAGNALCVPGNHENKLGRYLKGRKVQHTHGLAETIEQLDREERRTRSSASRYGSSSTGSSATTCWTAASWSSATPGCPRSTTAAPPAGSARTRCTATPPARPTSSACPCATRGPRTTAAAPPSSTATPRVPSTSWINNTICLDTGAVFGGKMTALRWPERELVDVPAEKVWYEPAKPLATEAPGRPRGPSARPRRRARPPDRGDPARWAGSSVREENAAAALEVMSRFAVDPRLLAYLPPTMAPTATSHEEGYLEHPAEAFAAVPGGRRRAGRVRGEAHGLARGGPGLPRRGGGAGAVRRRRARPGRCTPVPDGRSSTTPPSPRRSSAGCARPSPPPDSGTSWTPTGCCSTPS